MDKQINYDPRPTICNVCGGKVIYTNMVDVNISPYQSGKCYYCTNCGAYVGTHRKTPKEALGILGTGDVRAIRAICHQKFDKHYSSIAGKNRAYFRLSKCLGIPSEKCHFGYMDKEMLHSALKVLDEWEKENINFK